eukprot:g7177.t1
MASEDDEIISALVSDLWADVTSYVGASVSKQTISEETADADDLEHSLILALRYRLRGYPEKRPTIFSVLCRLFQGRNPFLIDEHDRELQVEVTATERFRMACDAVSIVRSGSHFADARPVEVLFWVLRAAFIPFPVAGRSGERTSCPGSSDARTIAQVICAENFYLRDDNYDLFEEQEQSGGETEIVQWLLRKKHPVKRASADEEGERMKRGVETLARKVVLLSEAVQRGSFWNSVVAVKIGHDHKSAKPRASDVLFHTLSQKTDMASIFDSLPTRARRPVGGEPKPPMNEDAEKTISPPTKRKKSDILFQTLVGNKTDMASIYAALPKKMKLASTAAKADAEEVVEEAVEVEHEDMESAFITITDASARASGNFSYSKMGNYTLNVAPRKKLAVRRAEPTASFSLEQDADALTDITVKGKRKALLQREGSGEEQSKMAEPMAAGSDDEAQSEHASQRNYQ